MKILCFHPAVAPYRVDFFNILSEFSEFHLALFNDQVLNQKFDQKQLIGALKCSVIFLLRGIQWRGRYLRFGVTRLLRKIKPDVVIGCEFSPTTCYLTFIRAVLGLRYKLYTTTDDNMELFEACHGLRSVLRRYVLKRVDGVIVADGSVAPYAKALSGNPSLKVLDVPIVYDETAFRADEDKVFPAASNWRAQQLGKCAYAIVFAGRLTGVKNVGWLLDRVADSRWPQGAKLFIVGSGTLEQELRTSAAALDICDRVVFCGRKEGFELNAIFAAADCLVLPSLREPFGAVVSECLQWGGRALVSSHVGAKSIVRSGVNGEVFNLDDIAGFYRLLNQLLDSLPPWNEGRSSLLDVSLKDRVSKIVEALGEN